MSWRCHGVGVDTTNLDFTGTDGAAWPAFDEHGDLIPPTADTCVAVFTAWAQQYPCARFLVIAMAPDGSDAAELGWGLALPEGVRAWLPDIGVTGDFRTADNLLSTMGTRLILLGAEPEYELG